MPPHPEVGSSRIMTCKEQEMKHNSAAQSVKQSQDHLQLSGARSTGREFRTLLPARPQQGPTPRALLSPMSAMATDSFRFCPPESSLDGVSAFSVSSTSRSISTAAACAAPRGTPCTKRDAQRREASRRRGQLIVRRRSAFFKTAFAQQREHTAASAQRGRAQRCALCALARLEIGEQHEVLQWCEVRKEHVVLRAHAEGGARGGHVSHLCDESVEASAQVTSSSMRGWRRKMAMGRDGA